MHPIDRTHGRGLAARQLPLDSGVYPPKRDGDVPGNELDDCGVCVLLPTVSGKGVRAAQVGCPVHGEPRRDSRRCPARYERPGGRELGDRIVACHLPAGHPGEHEEADTEVTWVDDAEPLERSDLPEGQQSKELVALVAEVMHRELDAVDENWHLSCMDPDGDGSCAKGHYDRRMLAEDVAPKVIEAVVARVRAAALRDAYKHLELLLNEYPVPVACAAGIDGEFHNWAFDQIGETEDRGAQEAAAAPAETPGDAPTPDVGTPTNPEGASTDE